MFDYSIYILLFVHICLRDKYFDYLNKQNGNYFDLIKLNRAIY